MNISDSYEVLFLQGGASLQFAMVPQNFMVKNKKADYVNTGAWSKKAIKEAKLYGEVNVVASSEDKTFSYIPDIDQMTFDPEADYVHITTNNTIYGTHFPKLPDTKGVTLVSDMSSSILSESVNVEDYGLIYAGAQKNIGPSGVTVVIVRKDLIGQAPEGCPTLMNYQTCTDAESMANTPPTYGIYIAGLVFQWLKKQGGVDAIHRVNQQKAQLLYDVLDSSSLFQATVNGPERSLMNIPFILPSEELNAKFIKEAASEGLATLKGHRTVGGMRASIYNAMPLEEFRRWLNLLSAFEQANG